MIIETNEVVLAIIGLFGLIAVIISYSKNKQIRWLLFAYIAGAIGAIATILENFTFPVLLNYVEHIIGVAFAGFLFFICAYLNFKKTEKIKSEITKSLKKVK